MRSFIARLFYKSPFDMLLPHAERVQECAWMFKKAIDCFLKQDCDEFEVLRADVEKLESQGDVVKRNIRGHLPKGVMMSVDKFQFFMFLREQDKVLDSAQDALQWLSFREETVVPQAIAQDLMTLVDASVGAIEMMVPMCESAREYFRSPSDNHRQAVKDNIATLRRKEKEADVIEKELKLIVFHLDLDPIITFYLIRVIEMIADVTDHAENAADMMRAMIAR